jgi:glutamate-5-semialdehyde dehydrogenase
MKGGREALCSNKALGDILSDAACSAGAPTGWMQVIETREEVEEILSLHEDIDLMIPRGSNAFVQHVMSHTKIPVLGHSDGICHLYVHKAADPEKARDLVVDAKTQYPAVCNAIETLLIDGAVAERMLPALAQALQSAGVELKGDERTRQILSDRPVMPATEEDWSTEYLDLVLSIKVVPDLTAAIEHINRYGSHHTDAIVTEDKRAARRFLREVDSSSVMHNASTRFADGFRYGLGAEIGISTNKVHSRGPVGLEGLVIYKYLLEGQGDKVATYAGNQSRPYTHKSLKKKWKWS